ncbi:putative F-box domain-containing protein [Medicago truncatula]|uniref:F-box SKIP28-like protein n=1 Tax=Medicago truncatula TaxID=3880 RepID=G7IWS4_MEDTR|nr:F-box protein SKIP23 [Medicago truncatula]AES69487.2 F-box SKIP28-like protein [Medicago truncatula]RHN66270.1 putative F-box domain-containing protein [Medicago truncatula]
MEADWSQLPRELLQLISQKLDNSELYLLRFRSVCSTWCSSVPNYRCNNHSFLKQIPQFPNEIKPPTTSNRPAPTSNYVRCLSKQNIFLIKPPNQQTPLRPWLIRIGPDLDGITCLWHPFHLYQKYPLRFAHDLIDFNQLPVLHLGHMFYIHGPDSDQTTRLHYGKVVVATSDVGQPLALLTYDSSLVPKIFRCGDNSWTSIPTMSRSLWGDICLFKGRPCVADKDGRTLMIGPDSTVHLLANPVFGGNVKHLVESECELLLVDCHGIDTSNADKDIRFDVFRLDENEKKWVKLANIGDIVLFVGGDCSFSAKASDLQVRSGNSVVYNISADFSNLDKIQSGMRIFRLDQGRVSKLSGYHNYIRLFWPPPEWIVRLHSHPEY